MGEHGVRQERRSSAGFAGATIPGGRFRKGNEAPLRVQMGATMARVLGKSG